MNTARYIFEAIGSGLILLLRTVGQVVTLPRQLGRVMEYSFQIGYLTFPIVAIVTFFLGAVLALQAGYSMNFSGGWELIGRIVGLATARELAPLMTAFLLAGRVGSAITAELASMTVYQEIDAQRTMQLPPERIHVLPRLVAILLMMPILTIVADFMGWFGGAVVSEHVAFISMDPTAYWASLKSVTEFKDVLKGLIKAEVFGFVVVLIACNQGLMTHGGPREIGFSVTKSVVSAMFTVQLLDYILTRILL